MWSRTGQFSIVHLSGVDPFLVADGTHTGAYSGLYIGKRQKSLVFGPEITGKQPFFTLSSHFSAKIFTGKCTFTAKMADGILIVCLSRQGQQRHMA